MKHKILNTIWRFGRIGIVAVDYLDDHYWQAYIGLGFGFDAQVDAEHIAEWGDKLSVKEALVYFPKLDIKKYKTYKDPDIKLVKKGSKK